MPEKPPAPSVLKARRRRRPVFIDEPIQWHLRNGKHDRCSWCGLQELDPMGSRKRVCMNNACAVSIELPETVTAWLEKKLGGEKMIYPRPPILPSIIVAREVYDLKEAQLRSETGRGVVVMNAGFYSVLVYWHRIGHLPERFDGKPAMAAGSDYWEMVRDLRDQKVWGPDEELNAMEVIARAATDEPMFAIMTG